MTGLKEIIYEYLERMRYNFKLKDEVISNKWSKTVDNFITAHNLSGVIAKDIEKFVEFSKIYCANDYFTNIWGDNTSNTLDEFGIKVYFYVSVNRVSSYICYWVENKNNICIFGNL